MVMSRECSSMPATNERSIFTVWMGRELSRLSDE